jgi:hypothetical protein
MEPSKFREAVNPRNYGLAKGVIRLNYFIYEKKLFALFKSNVLQIIQMYNMSSLQLIQLKMDN